jgi:hypothetical protein
MTIPSSSTTTYSTSKIIPAGQSVILLKTNKGCYLRTIDGKLYAIRNSSSSTSHHQQQPTPPPPQTSF